MRILVANRAEIACRIIESIQKMGHEAVAIYSRADKNMKHVKMADISVCVGPELASESYLNMLAILTAATSLEVEAIHPGYGFLSENSNFAKLCEELDITFIGPSSESIDLMGDKINALNIMTKASGSNNQFFEIESEEQTLEIASKIGLPLIIKYAQGGGGKGMRIVRAASELVNAYQMVLSEAKQAEPNPRIFAEKFIENAKHVEVQILADKHGDVITLGTRDCSLQRNGQKIIEEAPATISPDVESRLFEIAKNIAIEINYAGVGTVEFMVCGDEVYFLEMNTRLQVEHTVTEEIFKIDLVQLQIEVACGKHLSELQINTEYQGHAIECRINAEDPANKFMPCPGAIKKLDFPELARYDFGFEAGDVVPPFYDSMIGKIIVQEPNRDLAIAKMVDVLNQSTIEGIKTNHMFNVTLLNNPVFKANEHDTQFVMTNLDMLIREE
ncbi:biotin carboxylase N-terminal domain-containing protein [Mollicutes bacterium LVI A0039]|nr:biotin carboxylase N-terminal domain-containing protein [Mollicutes bacterium LVI A0039]